MGANLNQMGGEGLAQQLLLRSMAADAGESPRFPVMPAAEDAAGPVLFVGAGPGPAAETAGPGLSVRRETTPDCGAFRGPAMLFHRNRGRTAAPEEEELYVFDFHFPSDLRL